MSDETSDLPKRHKETAAFIDWRSPRVAWVLCLSLVYVALGVNALVLFKGAVFEMAAVREFAAEGWGAGVVGFALIIVLVLGAIGFTGWLFNPKDRGWKPYEAALADFARRGGFLRYLLWWVLAACAVVLVFWMANQGADGFSRHLMAEDVIFIILPWMVGPQIFYALTRASRRPAARVPDGQAEVKQPPSITA